MARKNPVIIHHRANLDRPGNTHPSNSLEAVKACLEAKAAVIEIDVLALANEDYLLVHNQTLEDETTGTGPVGECTPEVARQLRLKNHPSYTLPFLSDIVRVIDQAGYPVTLHIDYKNFYPFPTDEPLERFANLLEPIRDRVIISTGADWQLRKLSHIAPDLQLGFDPGFYLDFHADTVDERDWPPYHRGAYGLFDDNLLAREAVWPKADYLRDRCELQMVQVPTATTLFINHKVLLDSLEAGFDWAAYLHAYGKKLATYTLDVPRAADIAMKLAETGVDYITTNTPLALRDILSA